MNCATDNDVTPLSAQDRVFGIIEIFENVLACVPDRSLPSCAAVRRAWEILSLRTLWKELKDARPLFSLLGALEDDWDVSVSINLFDC